MKTVVASNTAKFSTELAAREEKVSIGESKLVDKLNKIQVDETVINNFNIKPKLIEENTKLKEENTTLINENQKTKRYLNERNDYLKQKVTLEVELKNKSKTFEDAKSKFESRINDDATKISKLQSSLADSIKELEHFQSLNSSNTLNVINLRLNNLKATNGASRLSMVKNACYHRKKKFCLLF